jgi:hypothetical protein
MCFVFQHHSMGEGKKSSDRGEGGKGERIIVAM